MRSMVQSYVRKAFDLIDDLATEVTLSQAVSTTFNYSTGEADTLVNPPVTITAFIKNTQRKTPEGFVKVQELLFKSEDLKDPTYYTQVTNGKEVWVTVPPYRDNGYTTTVELRRP